MYEIYTRRQQLYEMLQFVPQLRPAGLPRGVPPAALAAAAAPPLQHPLLAGRGPGPTLHRPVRGARSLHQSGELLWTRHSAHRHMHLP